MARRRSWIVKAAKLKLTLDLGDGQEWIEVKDRLTVGEERDLADKAMGDAVPDPNNPDNTWAMKAEMKMANYPINRALTWMTDWSFVEDDKDGKQVPMPVTRDNVRSLEREAFDAISEALDAHTEAMEASRKPANPTKVGSGVSEGMKQPKPEPVPLEAISTGS